MQSVLDRLASHALADIRRAMDDRYGIHTDRAFGVAMGDMKRVAKPLGSDHDLAEALWQTGWYEARIVASIVDDAALVTWRKWTAGVVTSTTGRSATPSASTCSTGAGRVAEGRAVVAVTGGVRQARGVRAAVEPRPPRPRGERRRRFVARPRTRGTGGGRRAPAGQESREHGAAFGRETQHGAHAAALATASRLVASSSASARWIGKAAIRDLER